MEEEMIITYKESLFTTNKNKERNTNIIFINLSGLDFIRIVV